jgi:hypothetical protein
VLQKVSKFLIKFTLWALQAFLGHSQDCRQTNENEL